MSLSMVLFYLLFVLEQLFFKLLAGLLANRLDFLCRLLRERPLFVFQRLPFLVNLVRSRVSRRKRVELGCY